MTTMAEQGAADLTGSLQVERNREQIGARIAAAAQTVGRDPATVTAFSRLDPMTAPVPQRPAIRSLETTPA